VRVPDPGPSASQIRTVSEHGRVPHWQIVDKMWDAYIRVEDVDAIYAEVQEREAENSNEAWASAAARSWWYVSSRQFHSRSQ